jgi:pimeloyl-ACP methyl ester carboxylesterase
MSSGRTKARPYSSSQPRWRRGRATGRCSSRSRRGFGFSHWTSAGTVGGDVAAFLEQVVGDPAMVSSNSSGGLVALWLAANCPWLVSGVVLEDAPVFSAEMPRFRDRDRFVYEALRHTVEALGDPENRDLADYFRIQELPQENGRIRRVPGWFADVMSRDMGRYEARHPGKSVDVPYLPPTLRLFIRSLSTFDPDFARAFVDGRFYEGLDHAAALTKIRCPMLVLHADWFRDPRYGLVGAMDDADAARMRRLVSRARY